jgi:hypothetical protein
MRSFFNADSMASTGSWGNIGSSLPTCPLPALFLLVFTPETMKPKGCLYLNVADRMVLSLSEQLSTGLATLRPLISAGWGKDKANQCNIAIDDTE